MIPSKPMAPATPDRTGTGEAYCELRALRTVTNAGLAKYVASLPDDGHVMQLRNGYYRTLLRDESSPWCDGLDTAAHHRRVVDLATKPVPELLTLAEAAELLPIGQHELNRLTRAWSFYPLYGRTPSGQGRVRFLFASQVRLAALDRNPDADPAEREAAFAVWLRQRSLLPPLTPADMVDVDLRPKPSPDPLPLDLTSKPLPKVCIEGLLRAQDNGWLEYSHPADGGYVIEVQLRRTAEPFVRNIPQSRVPPFLLGLADFHGRGAEFAYRAGLG